MCLARTPLIPDVSYFFSIHWPIAMVLNKTCLTMMKQVLFNNFPLTVMVLWLGWDQLHHWTLDLSCRTLLSTFEALVFTPDWMIGGPLISESDSWTIIPVSVEAGKDRFWFLRFWSWLRSQDIYFWIYIENFIVTMYIWLALPQSRNIFVLSIFIFLFSVLVSQMYRWVWQLIKVQAERK